MQVIAFNGSPRKNWNTATLLNKALEGAASQGAETELVHLYDLNYKGCISCFVCKTIGGKSYGKCPIKDDLEPLFKKVEEADAILLGSPIYWGRITGEMAAFMDRLMFQYLNYRNYQESLFPKKIRTAFIYTMNVSEEGMKQVGYDQNLKRTEMGLSSMFGSSETLCCYETLQIDDYSKYNVFGNYEDKAKRRAEAFPKDCQAAFELGVRLTR